MSRFSLVRCAWLLATLLSAPAFAVPVLSFQPASSSVEQGTAAVVDVGISGLADQLAGAYDLTIAWDPAILSFSSVTFGTFLDGPLDSIQGFIADIGSLNVFEISLGLLANQTGSDAFTLFSIAFDTLGPGTSALFFSDTAPQILGNDLGEALEFVVGTGSLLVRATSGPTEPVGVPEPGTLPLLALGILGIFVQSARWLRSSAPAPRAGARR